MKIKYLYILLLVSLFKVTVATAQVTAGFTASVVAGCSPLLVTFTNTTTPMAGTTFSWSFGTTGSSVLTNPSTSFTTVGTHLVTLTATNGSSTSTYTMTITVYPPPVVNFVADDTTVCPGTPITFTSTSTGGVPGPMTYTWSFGDGSGTFTGSPVSHFYATPGHKTVTLVVTNAQGCQATLVKVAYPEVLVRPTAYFPPTVLTVCNPPGSVTFSSGSTGTAPLTYEWTFGDGSPTGSGASPSHTYTGVGTYTVKLKVTDANGCTDSITRTNIVQAIVLAAEFTGPATACVFSPVTFVNTSSPHTTRTWTYGDGPGSTTGINGSHTYSAPGTYVVTLTIGSGPCTQTVTHPITILPGPTASFTASPANPCPAPQTITYTGTATPAGTLFQWSSSPGGGSFSGNPFTITWPTNGIKTITMIVIDPVTGCRDTVTGTDTLYDLEFEASALPNRGCVPLTVTFGGAAITHVPAPGTYPYPFPLGPLTVNWGDGSGSGTGTPPTHTYTAIGVYTATVTSITSNGCPVTDQVIIEVGAPPVVTYTANPLHICYGSYTPVVFTGTIVTGPVDEWHWIYGDGGMDIDTIDNIVSHIYTLPGVFSPTVIPYYRGCPGPPYTRPDYVRIDSPKAIIAHRILCTPAYRVEFGDSSLGDDSHVWIFGDGFTSTLDNPVHDYPALTTYIVQLATYNAASGCRDTATLYINLERTTPHFIGDDTVICRYDSVNFTEWITGFGTVSSYAWYDNGTYFGSDIPTITRYFTTPGYHTIQLVIQNSNGCWDTATRANYILVAAPNAAFSGTPVSGCLPLAVTFTDLSTCVPGTTIITHMWDFGDGGAYVGAGLTAVRTYTVAGTFNVTQIVMDNIGCYDTVTNPAYITVYEPVAAASASDVNPCENEVITFTNLSTPSSSIVSSVWDFGDGSPTSTVFSPTHAYTSTGTYTIHLTVTDSHGCTDDVTLPSYISVTKPVAAFSMSDSVSVCPPLTVTFTNTSTGAVSYAWDMGDFSTSSAFSPVNMYIAPGLYNVRLIASNAYGCTDTALHYVNIFGYAGAFSYTPLSGCVPLTVTFSATLSNVPSITWDFSDGATFTTSFSSTTTHVYATPGAYVPKLLLSDGTGCQNSSVGIDTIKVDAVNPKFVTIPHPVCIGVPFSFIDSSTTYFSPITSWAWTYDGNTSTDPAPTHTINTPGVYPVTLHVVNGWGCVGDAARDVVVDPPPIVTASDDTVVCIGDPATLYGYGAATYTWEAPATLSCTACNPTNATPTEYTTYTVTGTDNNGCVDTATVSVGLRTHTIANAWGDTAVCYGVPVQIFDTGGHTYLWLPPTGLNNNSISNPIATPPYTVIYTAIARLGSCIPDTNYVTVIIYPLPTVDAGPDQRLLAGSTAQLEATGTDIASYTWMPSETLSCTTCYNPVASMTVMTTYRVDVLSDHNCKASDSVKILLYCDNSQVFIPNAFTPNGDGENDVFYPRGIGVKTIKTFRIYNRWGELLFERAGITLNDASNAWDGSYKGGDPKPDVYVYIMEAVCYTGEDIMIKGDVTIIR